MFSSKEAGNLIRLCSEGGKVSGKSLALRRGLRRGGTAGRLQMLKSTERMDACFTALVM